MPQPSSPEPVTSPYRGADFYETRHRALFFGRKLDAENLLLRIYGHRLVLLHAGSGVGKTSILNAGVIPELEGRGLFVVVAKPHQHPSLALRRALIAAVLPPPAAECTAIDELSAIGKTRGLPDATTLKELCAWEAETLSPRDPDYNRLRRPRDIEMPGASADHDQPVVPFITRLFLLAGDSYPLARQMLAYEALAGTGLVPGGPVDEAQKAVLAMPLGSLRSFFAHHAVARTHAYLVRQLSSERLDLLGTIERLQALWARDIEGFGLVFILDQFEQVFTQYGQDRGPGLAIEDRDALFRDLGALLKAAPEEAGLLPPLKLVISMRDDFIAELDRPEAWIGTIEPSARVHLRPFTPEDVRETVESAAERYYKVRYEDAVIEEIKTLADDDQEIMPGHIQIVCTRLWREVGAALAQTPDGGEIGLAAMVDEKGQKIGAREMLDAHFQRILQTKVEADDQHDDSIERRSEVEQIEILDMLAPLITSRGTRNIVDQKTLTEAPLRARARREKLLEMLRRQSIVRVEPRLGGTFAEITHEFLITPVQKAREQFLEDDPAKRQHWLVLGRALARLQAIRETFRYPNARLLARDEIEALLIWLDIVDLEENSWIAEALYRSAIQAGLPHDELARLRSSLEPFFPELDPQAVWAMLPAHKADDRLLDDAELAALASDDAYWQRLDADERLFLLKSAIANVRPQHHDLIRKLVSVEP